MPTQRNSFSSLDAQEDLYLLATQVVGQPVVNVVVMDTFRKHVLATYRYCNHDAMITQDYVDKLLVSYVDLLPILG